MKPIQTKSFFKDEDINQHFPYLDFISIGIACHAFCLIHKAGILKSMLTKGNYSKNKILDFNNPHLISAALKTLVGAKIIKVTDEFYSLTRLGIELGKNIGLLALPLVGYRKLFCKQLEILNDPLNFSSSEIDFKEVALESIDFGKNELEPLLLKIFSEMELKGTICDLGCGTGEKLINICKQLNRNGLGIEQSPEVIKETLEIDNNSVNIEVIEGDVTTLDGIWEDVDSLLMSFVLHDIASLEKSVKILKSYKNSFPNMKYFVLVDIVSLSDRVPSIFPGFDYVHGLQGITPRTYEETLDLFKLSNYDVVQEINVKNMPNTFVWVLKPGQIDEK